jgi:thiol-disulfide isomerase/thioredoxin
MAEENKEEQTTAMVPHPFDLPCVYPDLKQPITVDMFKEKPKDVLNTKLFEEIGNKFLAKKGSNERERECSQTFEEVTAEFFEGTKYIGLLFSADWCAPCHTMMPLLRNFYTDINLDERLFEVILVSNDQNESDFRKHFGGMPWAAIPYGDPRIQEFGKRFKAQGIPKLVILDAKTGFKVTDTARKDLVLAS